MMLLGFLLLDDRLSRPPERELVARAECSEELLQFAAGHDLESTSLAPTDIGGSSVK
jgi:hypothetical protein